MEVRYNKGIECPVEISDGKTATCISLDTAKKLQATLLAVIKQAEMPEEEMSEFEKALEVFLMNADSSEETFHEEVKKHAAKLLALARDQFIKDGYVLEKKAFHDAVEKVGQEVMKEVSDKVDIEEAIRLGYEKGKADALKDLPRWIDNWDSLRPYKDISGLQYIVLNGKAMNVSDLSKLPRFKED